MQYGIRAGSNVFRAVVGLYVRRYSTRPHCLRYSHNRQTRSNNGPCLWNRRNNDLEAWRNRAYPWKRLIRPPEFYLCKSKLSARSGEPQSGDGPCAPSSFHQPDGVGRAATACWNGTAFLHNRRGKEQLLLQFRPTRNLHKAAS